MVREMEIHQAKNRIIDLPHKLAAFGVALPPSPELMLLVALSPCCSHVLPCPSIPGGLTS